MRENYDAVGFIPEPTVDRQYIQRGRYVLQADERGRRVGYLLHGKPMNGSPLVISQHCIQGESRLRGYGEAAVAEVRSRAQRVGASCITARCATDLPSLAFWRDQGFLLRRLVEGGRRRERVIAEIWLPLAMPLFEGSAV